MSRTALLWILWISLSLVGTAAVAAWMLVGGDRRELLIGETTGVHHQFEIACETCHAAEPFSEARKASQKMNKTCVDCHKEELEISNDSHPQKKFKNPRMADYWAKIDARFCTSCHIEHRPEITRAGAVTLAMNYCVACHSEGEQDVRKNRPSHAGLEFDTCASAGCHNFHDNRALYEDFLVKEAGHPWLKPAPGGSTPPHALSAAARSAPAALKAEMETWLKAGEAVAPESRLTKAAVDDWVASGHAKAGVNCAGCHAPKLEKEGEADLAAIEAAWIEKPAQSVCGDCHRDEKKTFQIGRHGMRGHPKIAEPRRLGKQLRSLGLGDYEDSLPAAMKAWLEDPAPPETMSVAEARAPMHDKAHGLSLTCSTCHSAHKADRVFAAVEACASCHADQHTAEYFDSPHHELWKAEISGAAPAGTGVSCADCHMPKIQKGERIFTNHNQNDVLRPNEKMIRPVCLDCHGLEFAIDALADPDLVARNFKGRPTVHIDSVEWAVRRVREGGQGGNQ